MIEYADGRRDSDEELARVRGFRDVWEFREFFSATPERQAEMRAEHSARTHRDNQQEADGEDMSRYMRLMEMASNE